MIPKRLLPKSIMVGDKIVLSVKAMNPDHVDVSYEDAEIIHSDERKAQDANTDPKTMPLDKLRASFPTTEE